jgi:hypothetical protein
MPQYIVSCAPLNNISIIPIYLFLVKRFFAIFQTFSKNFFLRLIFRPTKVKARRFFATLHPNFTYFEYIRESPSPQLFLRPWL